MVSRGVVREYHRDEGWGVIDGRDVPGGCWVHFSAIVMEGFRQLASGELVSFRWETVQDQDGYARRATKVWPGSGPEPPDPQPSSHLAYSSYLEIIFDDQPGY